MCGFPPSSFGNGGPAFCGIVVRGGRGGNRPGTHEPQSWDLVGRNAGRIPVWSRLPSFLVWRLGILGGGWGRREAKERMLRQRKRSVEARRAPRAAVSPCHSVTRADPVPAGEASLHPSASFPRGGCRAQRRRSERAVKGERGRHALALEIRLRWWFYTLPRGCSSPQRLRNQADNPSRGRPPRVCSPHDVRPSRQWPSTRVSGAPGRTMAACGDICPQLGPGAAIVPSLACAGWFRSPRSERASARPAVTEDQGRRGGSGECPGAAEPGARARWGRARTHRYT